MGKLNLMYWPFRNLVIGKGIMLVEYSEAALVPSAWDIVLMAPDSVNI